MKKNHRFLACALCVLFIPGLIFAQGEFLMRGESGWGIASSVAFSENSSGYGAAIGYSYKGVLDLGLGVGRSYPVGSFSGKTYGNFIAPKLTIFLQKQNNMPKLVSIALSMSYQFISLKQPVYIYDYTYGASRNREEIQTTKTDAGSITLSFIRNLRVDMDPLLQTVFSVEAARSGEVNQFGILAGLSVGSRIRQATLLAITPSVGVIIVSGQKFFVGGLELALIF